MKQIRKKFWSFRESITGDPVHEHHKFLWFNWTTIHTPEKFIYDDEAHLLQVVNLFIAENNILDIISFKDTAGVQCYMDYDNVWNERVGGIELVYSIEFTDWSVGIV